MGAEDNIKAIEAIYEAFGRGDLAAILEGVSDDVNWATDTTSTAAPWYGVRRGKAGVTAFFEAFGSAMEIEEFTPRAIAANDSDVLTVIRCRAKARATGKALDMNLHHYFVMLDGKIVYYRGTEDTVLTEAVLQP